MANVPQVTAPLLDSTKGGRDVGELAGWVFPVPTRCCDDYRVGTAERAPGDTPTHRAAFAHPWIYACSNGRNSLTAPSFSSDPTAAISFSLRSAPITGTMRSCALASTSAVSIGLSGVPRTA
jgi:hypothetical protein